MNVVNHPSLGIDARDRIGSRAIERLAIIEGCAADPASVGLLFALQNTVALLTYLPIGRMTAVVGLQPFIGLTFIFFALFPLSLALAPDGYGLILAFVVWGLREIGECPSCQRRSAPRASASIGASAESPSVGHRSSVRLSGFGLARRRCSTWPSHLVVLVPPCVICTRGNRTNRRVSRSCRPKYSGRATHQHPEKYEHNDGSRIGAARSFGRNQTDGYRDSSRDDFEAVWGASPGPIEGTLRFCKLDVLRRASLDK